MLKTFCFIVFIQGLMFLGNQGLVFASEQDLYQEKMLILKSVIHKDGFINEQIHREFWKGMPSFNSSQQKFMREAIVLSSNMQRENLVCVSKSLELGEPYKTKRWAQLADQIKTMYKNAPQDIDKVLSKVDTLINAALNKTPYYANGSAIYITKDLVESIRSGLDAGLERAQILLKKNWAPEFKERKIGQYAKVLWELPFSNEVEVLNINNADIKFTTYSSTVGMGTVVTISTVESKNNNTDACVLGVAKRFGVNAPQIINKTYQGYQSAEAVIYYKDGNQTFNSSIKCIDTQKSLYSIVVNSDSGVDGVVFFEMLLDRIMLF